MAFTSSKSGLQVQDEPVYKSELSGGSVPKSGTAAGTNTYTVTIPNMPILSVFQELSILFTNGNTAASTLNPNGIGATPMVKFGGTTLASGDIKNNQIAKMIYDGTNFQIISATDNIVDAT